MPVIRCSNEAMRILKEWAEKEGEPISIVLDKFLFIDLKLKAKQKSETPDFLKRLTNEELINLKRKLEGKRPIKKGHLIEE